MIKLIGSKKWALNTTLIAGALASGSALAQSNTDVYGILDVLLGPTTNITKDKGSTWRVSSSGMNTSRLGFRGSEDLGDGLKAVYQLEMGLAADTGTSDNRCSSARQMPASRDLTGAWWWDAPSPRSMTSCFPTIRWDMRRFIRGSRPVTQAAPANTAWPPDSTTWSSTPASSAISRSA